MPHLTVAVVLLAVVALTTAMQMQTGTDGSVPNLACQRPKPRDPSRFVITSKRPHEYLAPSDLPTHYNFCNISGVNYCTTSVNQHLPHWCASCYAIGTTSALSDRIRHARRNAFPDYMLSAQTILYCVPGGCILGGNQDDTYDYIYKNGISTVTCSPYTADIKSTGHQCTPQNTCYNCFPNQTCAPVVKHVPIFGISEWGDVLGVDQMKAEIFARGPIACQVNSYVVFPWGFGPDRKGIFSGGVNKTVVDHTVAVMGFGEEDGVPYWHVRNSWGEYWGDNGFFRLKMGDNQLGIESHTCAWAVPKIPTELMPQ